MNLLLDKINRLKDLSLSLYHIFSRPSKLLSFPFSSVLHPPLLLLLAPKSLFSGRKYKREILFLLLDERREDDCSCDPRPIPAVSSWNTLGLGIFQRIELKSLQHLQIYTSLNVATRQMWVIFQRKKKVCLQTQGELSALEKVCVPAPKQEDAC